MEQIRFPQQRLYGLGFSRAAWVCLHRSAAIAMTAAVVVHAQLHWRVIVARVQRAYRRLPGKAPFSNLALYFGFAALTSAAFAAWLVLPGLLHHPAIDLHNISGIILLPAVVRTCAAIYAGCFAFAADGFQVTGLDPAASSSRAARRHAAETGLQIRYEVGRGKSLPFGDIDFDIVCCCDVLEHVDDVGQVLREAARTLKPGGLFLYDTVNRTFLSKLVLILRELNAALVPPGPATIPPTITAVV